MPALSTPYALINLFVLFHFLFANPVSETASAASKASMNSATLMGLVR
jgi:hypothetical protein